MSKALPRLSFALIIFLLVACASAQQNLRQPLITKPINESRVVTLRGNTHPLARPMFDTGAAPPDLPMDRMLLVLKRDPQQEFALGRLLDDQQDKNSPNYHKWMTPTTFGAQFGTSDQDIQLVTGWLQTHGFEINSISKGRTVIEFSGVEAQVEQAFHTQIHRYNLPNGEQHWANSSDPQIPAALAPAVAGVWSMHDFKKKTNHVVHGQLQDSSGRVPFTNLGSGRHAILPSDFATIYDLNPLYNSGISGQGTTIAVVARSNINTSDVFSFRSLAGLPFAPLNITYNGPDPGIFDPNEEFEADLDASWSGGVAPGATVNFVLSASTNTTDGVDLSELYIVDNNVGDVMSESFGSCEGFASQAEAQAISTLAEQAAAEGITYMVSSGDSGAEGCDNPNNGVATRGVSVSVLSSPPFVTAVGGTMFNDNANPSTYWNATNNPSNLSSAKSYIPENVWNETCSGSISCGLWSSGGGVSTFFPKPNWQFGVAGIPNDGARDVPDVSLTAAIHDAYLLCFRSSCQNNQIYLVGGTSASAPSFAGIMALIVQSYGRQGQANYILYKLASSETLSQCNGSKTTGLPGSACVFNDVTVGNNAVPGDPNYGTLSGLYQAGMGYDLATGLGSVNANNLVTQWNTVTFNATKTTLGPSTITGTHGSSVTLNISVAPSSGTGTPTGEVSVQTGQLGNANPAFLTLSSGSVSAPVNNLPGGAYTLTARYAGDLIYAPSTSSGVAVDIAPENSTTTASVFTTAPNGAPIPLTSASFGSFIYPRADVASVSGNGIPTGSVDFFDNGNLIAPSVPLNSQGNTAFPNGYPFAAGQHSFSAAYRGDASFSLSTSSPVTFTITPASTFLRLSASPISGANGSPINFTATLTSSAFAGQPSAISPTGNVTFSTGTTVVGTTTLFPNGLSNGGVNGIATFTTSSLPVGSNVMTAQYSGDNNYSGSTSSGVPVAVSPDFAFDSAASTVTISQGGSGTETLTITGQSGYNDTVAFTPTSCSQLPNLATCSFNPSSVVGSGTTTVTIRTIAPSTATARGLSFTAVGFVFAGVLLMGVPSRRFRSGAVFSVVVCLLAIGSVACGGGAGGGGGGLGNPGTPKGSYTITITAVGTTSGISHTTSFNLLVQ